MTEAKREPLPAPDGLGERALRLWAGVTTAYDLRVDDVIVLEDACREIDLIDRLEDDMPTSGFTVKGGYGSTLINPVIPELRQHRALLAKLLGQLKLPDDPGTGATEDASTAARRAANARWGR